MEFILKNCMRHSQFGYPESLVTYDVSFEDEPYLPPYAVECDGIEYPAQFSALQYQDGRVIAAKVSFITDLPCHETKRFLLKRTERCAAAPIAWTDADTVALDNGKLIFSASAEETALFRLRAGSCVGVCTLDSAPQKKTVELLENGPVFAELRIRAYFPEQTVYEQVIRLSACDEYVLLDESMRGTGTHTMSIRWEGLSPRWRAQKYNGTEKRRIAGAYFAADEYTEPDGLVSQARLTPYDQTSGAASTEYMSFVGPQWAAGVFAADANRWWNGEYTIEGYPNDILPTFYCRYHDDGCALRFHFPLHDGSRQCGLAIYPARKEPNEEELFYIQSLRFHAALAPLNAFKDWVLDWDTDNSAFPRFFDAAWVQPELRYGFVERDAKGLPGVETLKQAIFQAPVYRWPHKAGACFTRVFEHWIPAFDILAGSMTPEDFRQLRAIFAYYAYLCSREDVFPVTRMLAGHANFLLDVKNIVGICAAMFPEHPHAKQWKEHYEKSAALVLKYHVRPEVKAWQARGGRYTESYGTYLWGSMKHAAEASLLLTLQYQDNPLLYPTLTELAQWICDIATPPIAGRRTIPYFGAHAGCHEQNPVYPLWQVRLLGLALRDYAPDIARQLLALCPPEPCIGHECYGEHIDVDIWSMLMRTIPNWDETPEEAVRSSEKYTGYGYVLRSQVGTPDEMMVLLQQIDRGPNYRWGRAARGGCGNVTYYADGKVFSGVRKEDFGDDNFTDDAVGCNFCVLVEQTYKSVGMHDLTHPLVDVDFLKYARVDAGEYSDSDYSYRSVMMLHNRYIVIYDAVKRERTEGRFTWNSYTDGDSPYIWQLRPGVEPRVVKGAALTLDGKPRYQAVRQDKDVTARVYDGYGDFLTLVTHRDTIKAQVTEFGALVTENGHSDYIFNANRFTRYEDDTVAFEGKVGFASAYENGAELCIVDGVFVRCGAFALRRLHGHGSISLRVEGDTVSGRVVAEQPVQLEISAPAGLAVWQNGAVCPCDGTSVTLAPGRFCLSKITPAPARTEHLRYVEVPDGITLFFNPTSGAVSYELCVTDANGASRCLPVALGQTIPDIPMYATLRVRAVGEGGTGQWSAPLPVHPRKAVPTRVEGLRVLLKEGGTELHWGRKEGVSAYRLYREEGDVWNCISESRQTVFFDPVTDTHRYFVTCVNGFGESAPSLFRDSTPDGLAAFDPMPNRRFIRDTIVNHHGYGGFDYEYNENRQILTYPD